jgi:hypothetical protein
MILDGFLVKKVEFSLRSSRTSAVVVLISKAACEHGGGVTAVVSVASFPIMVE